MEVIQWLIINLNVNKNKIINLSDGVNVNDAVTFSQLKSHTSNIQQVNYHLQSSFTFFKNFCNKSQLQQSIFQLLIITTKTYLLLQKKQVMADLVKKPLLVLK